MASTDLRRALEQLAAECSGEESEPQCGYVYAVRWRGQRMVKIGRTDNHPSRVLDLQASCPVALEIVGIGHWSLVEKALHDRHAGTRRFGEWFELDAATALQLVAPRDGLCFGCAEKVRIAAETPGMAVDLGTRHARWQPYRTPPKQARFYKRELRRARARELMPQPEYCAWGKEVLARLEPKAPPRPRKRRTAA